MCNCGCGGGNALALRDDLPTDGSQMSPVDPGLMVSGSTQGTPPAPASWFESNWPWLIGGAVVLALVIHFMVGGNARRKRR